MAQLERISVSLESTSGWKESFVDINDFYNSKHWNSYRETQIMNYERVIRDSESEDMIVESYSKGKLVGLAFGLCIGIALGIGLAYATVSLWKGLICL